MLNRKRDNRRGYGNIMQLEEEKSRFSGAGFEARRQSICADERKSAPATTATTGAIYGLFCYRRDRNDRGREGWPSLDG